MMAVFVDTVYWIARANPDDSWAESAKNAKSSLTNPLLVTTDEVLTEFLNSLAGYGDHLRRIAIKMVRAIIENPNVKVIPQTRDSFLKGMELYENRLDKEYSLTDCISMNVMKNQRIIKVLTKDHHFEQEGLEVLMKRE